MDTRRKLIFVYNADSGLFNTLADMGHKIFSPSTYECRLCALTHGYFSMRKEWAEWLAGLDADLDFLHRDEFIATYPGLAAPLPAVFLQADGSEPICLLDTDVIRRCADLTALQVQLEKKLATV